MTPDYFLTLARYNRWMNGKVYAAASLLTPEERKADRGAFFGSIHGTLNHLLVADHIWMSRFTGVVIEGDAIGPHGIKALDQELHADFAAMETARAALDEDILRWTGALTAERLTAMLRFVRKGVPNESPLWWNVAHVFNHQTHHRGQVTTLLTQAGKDVGSTDLIAMLREEAASAVRNDR